ncbi:MAG: glycoside hydrolase family 57 protein [Bacteroidales bacterium]|nr:glycoside hydrolase family 57 protein [Bacteroidales bacterium]
MKKSICLSFHLHQPTRLRQYRFFDIGNDSHYYDDFANRTALKRVIEKCYLPANAILLDLIKACKGKFRIAFTISGSVLEQFERYAPEVIDSFKALCDTGCVELVGTTYNHSLASLASENEFRFQVNRHRDKIKSLFGVTPTTFSNTELIYSDSIGATVYSMGFDTILAEGAKNALGWKSPDYVYNSAVNPELKLLLRNYSLSDDVAGRFSDKSWDAWPLSIQKYTGWVANAEGEVVSLFMDYESFGLRHDKSGGIFDFLSLLPSAFIDAGMEFVTPSQATAGHKGVGPFPVEQPLSWYGAESDVSAWLGNELQQDAFKKLYALAEKLAIVGDDNLWADFGRLQESGNFYYMNTRFFSAGESVDRENPYPTPYEAFINYMNVLSDFSIRVNNSLAEK